jgi:beta-mannosidase
MDIQAFSTARLGILREPRIPAPELKAEVASVTEWVAAALPGSVHQHLLQAGVISDPYKDFNARQAQWIEKARFIYLIPFKARPKTKSAQYAFLTLEGIDTFARVYLNGHLLTRLDNAFRSHEIEVTGPLRWDADNLLVLVLDPLIGTPSRETLQGLYDPHERPERLVTRRSQMAYGVGAPPHFLGPAIRGPVALEYRSTAWFEDIWVHTVYARPGAAYLEAHWRIRATQTVFPSPLRLAFTISHDGEPENHSVEPDNFRVVSGGRGTGYYEASGTVTLTPSDPQLWYPHTHGHPALYTLESELRTGAIVLDQSVRRFGIRTTELLHEKGTEGRHTLRLKFNGLPIRARGAVWMPADALSLYGERNTVEFLLKKARSLGLNLIRAWGGGVYESETFYDLCDTLGLLVWQDFPFARGGYPMDNHRLAGTVREEVVENLFRLRRHPCLALLCGNDECQLAYLETPQWRARGLLAGETWFTKELPNLCADHAPDVPYIPGSPHGSDQPNLPVEGDTHAWAWWRGRGTPAEITWPIPSFLSAFGVPAPPDPRTLDEFVSLDRRVLQGGIAHYALGRDHERMLAHQARETSTQDWDAFQMRSWELQARVVSDTFERLRVAPDECGGILAWALNDPFPGFGWGLFDWRRHARPVVSHLQNACSDLLIVFVEGLAGTMELRILNERSEAVEGDLRIRLLTLEGKTLHEEELHVEAGPQKVLTPWSRLVSGLTSRTHHSILLTAKLQVGDDSYRTHRFLVPIADLVLPLPAVLLTVRPADDETLVQFRSDRFVRWVLIQTDDPGTNRCLFGFDLLPGETVQCAISSECTQAQLTAVSPGLTPKLLDLTRQETYDWHD